LLPRLPVVVVVVAAAAAVSVSAAALSLLGILSMLATARFRHLFIIFSSIQN
jgi:hypothetical protein